MTWDMLGASVVLTEDIPELGLARGISGVVCSTWFAPSVVYEVEFQPPGCCKLRALLLERQLSAAPPRSQDETRA